MAAGNAPASHSTYDEYTATSTTRQTTGPSLNLPYVISIPGIIKIAEIVLSIITFICSIVHYWTGHGWVEFVSFSAFLSALVYFILTLLNLINFVNRFPGPWLLIEELIPRRKAHDGKNMVLGCGSPFLGMLAVWFHVLELIYSLVFAVFYLIAAIVAAAYASYFLPNVGATAFFAFVATTVFTIDTVYQYKAWSRSDASMRTQTTTTTTDTAAVDKRTQY